MANPPSIPLLTDMSSEADPTAHRAIVQEEQARVFGNVAGGRVLGMPLFMALLLVVAWFDPHRWRSSVLVAISVTVPTFVFLEFRRYKKLGFESNTMFRNLLVTALAQLAMSAATGGLLSPFIYGVLPLAGVAGTFLEPRRRLALAGFQIAVILSFAFLALHPTIQGFDAPVASASAAALPAAHYTLHATVLSLVTLGVGQISHVLSAGFAATFRRASAAQHELLLSHAERVRELTTLSAEIAHELKNPLASVKGLSALLTQNVTDDRGGERLRVLRREIDRMQGVLEEFLNFSRPLVPLSLKQCNVREVASEVVALHEGLARQRGVRLALAGPLIEAHCDPRKVKQILINLVQNALEASPAGSQLTVDTEQGPESVSISVADEGEGLDAELGDVFEPGITSKPGGAGIGLTIARALARQHQGELTLRRRDGKGTIARLELPKQPAVAQTQEVA